MLGRSTQNRHAKPRKRITAALLCCLVLTAGASIAQTATAYAGTWTDLSCKLPGGQPAPTEGWATSSLGGVGADSGDVNTCAEGGSLIAVTSSEAPQNAYQGPAWVYEAPTGSTIAGGTLTATITAPHGQAWLATPTSSYDGANVLANCQYNVACGASGSYTNVFPITHPGGSKIYAVAVCVGPYEGATTCPAYGGLDAAVYVIAAAIELANKSTPNASGFTGTLLDPGARSTQELLFTANDPDGPGVYTVTAEIDGATLYTGTPNTNGGDCAALASSNGTLTFDHTQPCPQSESVDLPINTTGLLDGPHTLKLTVEDAAANTSVVHEGTITTHNAPESTTEPTITAPAPLTLSSTFSAHPGEWSAPSGAGSITYAYQWEDCDPQGQSCQAIPGAQSPTYTPAPSDAGHTLRATVIAADNDGAASTTSTATSAVLAGEGPLSITPRPGTPTAATTPSSPSGSGTPNGTPASESAILRLKAPQAITRHFAGKAFKLTGYFADKAFKFTGRLTDSQSHPIAGATLDVLEQADGSNTPELVKHATTGANGTFSVTLPAGPSRQVEVAYHANTSDSNYAASATVQDTVHAGVQLHINKHRTGPTETIILTGKVQGPVPHQGTRLGLLVHYHGHWEPIRTPRTKSNGQFKIKYTFEDAVGRFPFCIEIPAGQANYPYTAGYSNTVNVST
jgi:hypothetical protein